MQTAHLLADRVRALKSKLSEGHRARGRESKLPKGTEFLLPIPTGSWGGPPRLSLRAQVSSSQTLIPETSLKSFDTFQLQIFKLDGLHFCKEWKEPDGSQASQQASYPSRILEENSSFHLRNSKASLCPSVSLCSSLPLSPRWPLLCRWSVCHYL